MVHVREWTLPAPIERRMWRHLMVKYHLQRWQWKHACVLYTGVQQVCAVSFSRAQ
jgi:hypothetical protein